MPIKLTRIHYPKTIKMNFVAIKDNFLVRGNYRILYLYNYLWGVNSFFLRISNFLNKRSRTSSL
ncbi:hypothetical protein E0D84_01675 [Bacillus wiedmannii]|nr:hypothetical protein E0D84_01675 [Bacillus wiedmannii]